MHNLMKGKCQDWCKKRKNNRFIFYFYELYFRANTSSLFEKYKSKFQLINVERITVKYMQFTRIIVLDQIANL
jgi:hypothetical protein